MKRKKAIKAIKDGTHVLAVESHSKEAEDFVNNEIMDESKFHYWTDQRYYGLDDNRIMTFLYENEINNRPIIKLSDILSLSEVDITDGQEPVTIKEANNPLDSTSETPISEMREYDEELLDEWFDYYYMNPCPANVQEHKRIFLKNRYPNKELEQEKDELLKRLAEINKQLGVE
jgi:hypothetical protein